ncbi:hypothetical protein BG015_006687 [Linnemannia schmuckeri]|uniref:Uncharacterized protein n=1 Tax=Linnemannia schmuckeri TaxID=64567 RepID=A0A9P5VBX7_9FUNG|nr:hypothetical protein BG015_006687 [Linnemannia schmuckeri]
MQQQQQAILSNILQQQSPSTERDDGYSELIRSGPPQIQESKSHKPRPQYNRPLIPAPQNWVQSTFDTDNNNQGGIEDKYDDDEELEEDYHSGQQYHQQAQQDWRDLRRLNKIYVPLPRLKRGRKGRGDFFKDDYHAGYNKIEIQALSSARKAAYEAQRQNHQYHNTPQPPPPPSAPVKEHLE